MLIQRATLLDGTVVPGLHDHHVHLRSAAAALESVHAGPPHVRCRDDLARALSETEPGNDGWIRAVGYHESVAGSLDRAALDALAPRTPVRVQHRSGALWVLNSTGLAAIGMAAPPDQGTRDVESLAAACRSGELRQRLHCLASPEARDVAGVAIGPVKIILDDASLDFDLLESTARRCHSLGRGVAVHCVTDSQLVVTIAALQAVGAHPGDRVEHAAVVPDDCLDDLAGLGVTVVTQPNFVAERGDAYLSEVPGEVHGQLWRLGSLLRRGINVALSTDMPFGDGDPWAAMRAAVHRRTPSGATLVAAERVSPVTALTMFLGRSDRPARSRTVEPGQPGDLCLLGAPPREVLGELDSGMVGATIVGGEIA